MDNELAGEVRAYFRPKGIGLLSEDARLMNSSVTDIRTLSAMVVDLEKGQRNTPVLLKQYLRLGGRMISFGIDDDFGSTLDCLVVVPLQNTPERIRQRYQGKDYNSVTSESAAGNTPD